MGKYASLKHKGKRVKANLVQKWYAAIQRYGLRCRNVYVRAWTT